MSKKTDNWAEDIQGAGKLVTGAVKGITNIVEALHYKILRIFGFTKVSKAQKTSGISGKVYDNIRMITQLTGKGVDVLLEKFKEPLNEKESSVKREAILAVLNGVIGDYLAESENPLALKMQFRHGGKPLNIESTVEALKKTNAKLLILVHGLCMNDLEWSSAGHDHGLSLSQDLGFVPVYLHYNSGCHISENAREFSNILEKLNVELSQSTELYFLAHSMGGLICRSALWQAQNGGQRWPSKLKKMVFLGTPHHGAPLEKAGNLIDNILEGNKYSAPFARLGKIRSAGITDLRFGNLQNADWQARDRFELTSDLRVPIPLPTDIPCYTVGATISKANKKLSEELLGDGLVPLSSALGRHQEAKFNLQFPESHQYVCRGTKHLDLLNSSEVYKIVKRWLFE